MSLPKKPHAIIIVIIVIALIAGWFYWFQFRPYKIYSGCSKDATERAIDYNLKEGDEQDIIDANNGRYTQENYDLYYNRCLRLNGVNAENID